jgi:hypothetical protein
VAEEYCWAISRAVWRRSCCGCSGCTELEFGFQLDSLVYAHEADHAQTCARPS